MMPRLTSTFVSRWILVTLTASIVNALSGGTLGSWLALAPARIFRGELWRLVTWPVVEVGPLSLVLTCVAIYKFGGELAERWGDRRLQRFILEVVVAAAAVTCIAALVTGGTYMYRLGGWAVADVLVIAWARQFPERPLVLYGLVTVSGQQLIYLTVGVALLYAIFVGPVVMAPEVASCLIAAQYPLSRLRR